MSDIDNLGIDKLDRFKAYSERFRQFSIVEEVYLDTLQYILQLRQERDEARREVCEAKTDIGFSKPILSHMLEYAVYRGWNCFNKNPMDKIAKLDEEMGLND